MCRGRLRRIQYLLRRKTFMAKPPQRIRIGEERKRCFIGRFMEHRKMAGSGSVSPVREGVYIEEK